MAMLHPAHRVSTARTSKRGIHPSICLVTGFGFIMASALAVHVVFNALM